MTQAGTSPYDGTAAHPWRVSDFNTAGNWGAGAGKISSDDTVYLGGAITTALTIQGSGTAGHPITIRFSPGAYMTSTNWANSGAINVGNHNYVVVNGGALTDIGGPKGDPAAVVGYITNTDNGTGLGHQTDSYGVRITGGTGNIVENLAVYNMYVRTSGTDMNSYGGAISATAYSGTSIGDVTVSNCRIHDAFCGVDLDYDISSGTYIVYKVTAYHCNWGGRLGDRSASSTMTKLSVANCYFYDWTNWDAPSDVGLHHNGFFAWSASGGVLGDCDFYGNKIGPDYTQDLSGYNASTSGLFASGKISGTIRIFDNVFLDNGTYYGPSNGLIFLWQETGGASGTYLVQNNTFLGGQASFAIRWSNSSGSAATLKIQNNIYQGNDSAEVSLYNANTTLTADHNVGFSMHTDPFDWNATGSGGGISLAAWKTATGQDADFRTTTPNLNGAYAPRPTSSAIGTGVDLSAQFTTDYNGATRTTWDIGAVNAQTTFYIDYAGGDDANPGTLALPWKRHPYMTGWTGTYTHAAGDRFVFKGGVTWPSACWPMTIAGSGSSGAGNDYYGIDATWFSGGSWTRPIFDREYTSAANSMIDAGSQTRLTFDNLEICHLNTTAADAVFLLYFSASGANCLVENCYVHGWRTAASVTADGAHGGIGGMYYSPFSTTLILDNTEVTNLENANALTTGTSTSSVAIGTGSKTFAVTGALTVSAGDRVIVSFDVNNAMSGQVTSFSGGSLVVNVGTVLGSGTHASWTIGGPYTQNGDCVRMVGTIRNGSKIHDCGACVLFCLDFNGSQMYNATGDDWDVTLHTNGIYLDPANMGQAVGYIRNSYLHDVALGANMAYPNPHDATIYLYNNVLYGTMSAQLAVEIDPYNYGSGTGGTVIAYNNTIYNGSSGSTAFHVVSRSPVLAALTLINNHVMNASSLTDAVQGTNVTTYTNSNNLSQSAATAAAQGYTLGNLYAPTSASSGSYNFGIDESATFGTDVLGVPRPQAAVWDAGAYEFVVPGTGGGGASGAVVLAGNGHAQ